ncbi:MAG: hypothetical protein KDK36_03500, partial [Leptospiraceae bacterium]|nr:hypothetical protein [Leptospiraceae bacterium]
MSKFEKTGKYLAYSNIYNDVYWSKEGGLEEKKYVFIDGNNLIEKWKLDFTDFTIFELGFGAGLNFLATWKEWNQLNLKNKTLHYISVEKFPLTKQEIKTALEDFEEISSLLEKFLLVYDSLENGIHHFSFPE